MAKPVEKKPEASGENKYAVRRWVKPKLRAASYAQERKEKKHKHGPKQDKALTDYEAGIRSGYLQAQTDHAGLYKYKKAISEGKSKAEAREISQRKSK